MNEEFENMKRRLSYLEDKLNRIENQLGFNHSGIDSIKARIELLESYSIVNDHNEFNSLFGDDSVSTSGNLFRQYLKLKLEQMYRIISTPPNITAAKKEPNEVYNFDKFPPYDKVEKLFHQSLLLLLFASPSFTPEFQAKLLHLIHNLRGCYWVVPGIIEWIIKPNEKNLQYVKSNFHAIIDELSSHNSTLI